MKFAYFPGCSAHGTSLEYETSTRAVCGALDLSFTEIEDWNCCGSTPAHSLDAVLSAALAARNLTLAKNTGAQEVITPCPSCLSNLKLARLRMQNGVFKARVDALLDAPTPASPSGGGGADLPDTFSVLQVLLEQIGPDAIRARVTRPLEGIRVAPYYGCLMSRPAEAMRFDDPENPVAMDRILDSLGVEVLPFPLKTECCGAAMGIPRKDVTSSLTGRILSTARAFGADAIAVACPLCHMNLDLRQNQAERSAGTKFAIPILYYTQFMGLAFGLPPDNLRLDKLAVSPSALLAALADRRAAKAEAPKKSEARGSKAASPAKQGDAS